MDRKRIADYVLFEKTASTVFGDRFRAAKVDGVTIPVHAHLYLLNGAGVDPGSLWSLVGSRQQLVAALDDPHLGECLAFDRHEDVPYVAYKYAPGRPLSQLLAALRKERSALSLEQSLFVVEQAALGLTAAQNVRSHRRPLLHGFLIPDLLHISGEGHLQIFGIEVAPGLRSQLARHPAFAPYIAPEARSGEPPAETDDVFSLGAILFHLLCDHPPPAEEPLRIAETVDDALSATESAPLPTTVANLLKASLSPKPTRIRDVAAWGRVVSRIIRDGSHTSTDFSLSFLMHSVFRRELDNEVTLLAREQRQLLMPGSVPQIESLIEPDPEIDLPSIPETGEVGVEIGTQDPFVTGFLISFLTAMLLMTGWLVFLR
jgi:serine/threonine protein kinase